MSNMSKRDREKRYFDMFREHYPIPCGDVEYGDKPDIIINGNRKIGIELTNLYHDDGRDLNSEQVQHRLRKKIISTAHKMYRSHGGKDIELSFCFDKNNPITDAKNLSRKIADIAKDVENQKSGLIENYKLKNTPELSSIYGNSNEYSDPEWRLTQVHHGKTLAPENLIKRIREKESLLRGYRACDVYWLLVVVDFFDSAQDQEIELTPLDKIKSDVFEKILIFRTAHGHIVEITQ